MDHTIDIATLIAVVSGTFAILATMISLFLWLRTEANADRRHFQDLQREDRKDLLEISNQILESVDAIQSEVKDFHQRLMKIESNKA